MFVDLLKKNFKSSLLKYMFEGYSINNLSGSDRLKHANFTFSFNVSINVLWSDEEHVL